MDQRVKQALLLGRESYRRGDDEAAERFLLQVVERGARYADVFDMLGVIASRRGDYERAERHFRRAIDLNADYTEAHLNLVVTYNELGRYDDAREIYLGLCAKRGAAERPSEAPQQLDDPTEAGTGSLQGRQLDLFELGRIADLHAQTARAYEDVGCLEEAIRELEKAVELGSGFPDLRVRLGHLLRAAGRPERAEEHYRAAILARPDYAEAYLHLGAALLAADRPQEALQVLGRLRELDPEGGPQARIYERAARQALS